MTNPSTHPFRPSHPDQAEHKHPQRKNLSRADPAYPKIQTQQRGITLRLVMWNRRYSGVQVDDPRDKLKKRWNCSEVAMREGLLERLGRRGGGRLVVCL